MVEAGADAAGACELEFWELWSCAAASVAIRRSKLREISALRYDIFTPRGTRSVATKRLVDYNPDSK